MRERLKGGRGEHSGAAKQSREGTRTSAELGTMGEWCGHLHTAGFKLHT